MLGWGTEAVWLRRVHDVSVWEAHVVHVCRRRARDKCGAWDGGEWTKGLGLGFTNPLGTGGVWDMCLCMGRGGVGDVVVRLSAHVHFNLGLSPRDS